jgi:hypothetical protein
MSFMEQCLGGAADLDDIDDFIDVWHAGGTGVELWEFLGMTRDEYGLWVENPAVLVALVESRRRGTTVAESAHVLAQATNRADAAEMREVEHWLRMRAARAL